jgi:hypothetical protein
MLVCLCCVLLQVLLVSRDLKNGVHAVQEIRSQAGGGDLPAEQSRAWFTCNVLNSAT